jgi:hypothetical protein
MKKWLLNLGTMSMALLVLFSSLSFGVSKHYCAGEVAAVSYFVAADGCAMEENRSSCDSPVSSHVEKKSCCETKYQFVDGNDFLQKENASLIGFDVAKSFFYYSEISFQSEFELEYDSFVYYSSPILLRDRTVLFETYLI